MNTYNNYILNQNQENKEYNGGYSVQSMLMENQTHENKQTGGNKHTKFSQFQDMVIPIGLVLDNRCNSHIQKSSNVFDENYEHKYVDSAFFDKLLYSVNSSVEKRSKTEKNRHPSNKKTMKK
jgi:hypothetical protein